MDEKDLKPLRIVYIAMIAGVTFFAVVAVIVAFLVVESRVPTADQLRVANVVSLGAGVVALVCWKSARLIFRRMVAPPGGTRPSSLRLRQAYIVRLVMYEAAALFGLGAFLVDGIFGVLRQNPIYALTLTPYLTFVTVAVSTFPTPASIQRLLQS